MSSELFEIELTVVKGKHYQNDFGRYYCTTDEWEKVEFDKESTFVIIGTMPVLNENGKYKATLKRKDHPTFGVQYEVKMILNCMPTTKETQRDFLKTMMTELQLKAIYNAYPDQDIIALMKDDAIDHRKVKGIGEFTYGLIRKRIIENLDVQQALATLGKYDISYKMIMKMVSHYGSAELLIQMVEKNPYELTSVSGIGFKKADEIAKNMGFDMNSPYRIRAAITYVIEEEQRNGHTYIEYDELIIRVRELISRSEDCIKEEHRNHGGIILIGDRVSKQKTYNDEKYIAEELKHILDDRKELLFDVESFITNQEQLYNISLTDQQKSFFYNIKKYGVNFLVGYAGCGKSMLQKLFINLLEEMGLSYALLSPTGKAAKVLAKYTERAASTIHRATGVGKDESEGLYEIDKDFVIVDEASMLGVSLCARMLRRLTNKNVRVLFIGDDFQIASVDMGNFLYDSINSGALPVTKLDIVFRQSEGGILDIATKIRQGEKFIGNKDYGTFKFGENVTLYSAKQDRMVDGCEYSYRQLMSKYSPDDIMVLSPTKKSDLGTYSINKSIQKIVNPHDGIKQEWSMADCVFRESDNVINVKNTYDVIALDGKIVDIVNGDTGKIQTIDIGNKIMNIDYGFCIVPVKLDDLDNILHSYCITMHKSQGSAAKAVLVIMDKSQKRQMNANLLYTAVTRASDYLIILAQADVINYAMTKNASLQRNTFLMEMLMALDNE
ncbi:AAA family ATPase [Brevibacillus porteri]|uniref:AAA family ATPase n=1 Tax=Brevibacillus porteri TaxID=2126350 RepID=UPI00362926DD